MNKTRIPWADFTWSPVTGCTPVSEGCEHCYAERMARRFNAPRTICEPKQCDICDIKDKCHFKVTLHPERLDEPLKRRKAAKIFVCSMGDLFHPDVPDRFIYSIFLIMQRAKQHTFLILTKRPKRMKAFIKNWVTDPLPSVWIGVTAENQARADERIPLLLETPAAKRFVSIEPMLGPISLAGFDGKIYRAWLDTQAWPCEIDWVIVGGETGPGARECREEWVQEVYNQCQAAGVPFFFKQCGTKWTSMERGKEIAPYPKAGSYPVAEGIWLQRREWSK